MTTQNALRVGYVPEHFSTPLHFAVKHGFFTRRNLNVKLHPFPSGTGHMIKSLESASIDLAIGLTEGWIAALSNGSTAYKLVGEYVSTPLRWAISTGAKREIQLSGVRKLGVSRIGSGSYVMGFVLADRDGVDSGYEYEVCDTFVKLREAVNEGRADAFMWEYFTTKKYYDNGEIKQIGYIDTPWPSWHIVARTSDVEEETMGAFLEAVKEGVEYFNGHKEESVEWIAENLDYSVEDAREWLGTVEFTEDCRKVKRGVMEKTVDILKKAGVVGKESTVGVADMVISRALEGN